MSTNYKNILVGIDGSAGAEFALKKAIEVAKRNNATLVITHVIDTLSFAIIETYDTAPALEKAKDYAKTLLEKYKAQAEADGVSNVLIEVEYGSPKTFMTKKLIGKYEIDLVVCGATGMNAVERFMLGSVSSYITRHATCDVLVVKTAKE